MVSRRSLTIIFLALISAWVLLLTSRRLNDWEWDNGHYRTDQFVPHVVDLTNATSTNIQGHAQLQAAPPSGGDNKPIRPAGALPPDRDPVCDNFPNTTGILLVMKTGATESFDKIPMQLMTTLRCLPDFLIFSDLEQQIAGYHIRDSLDTVLAEAKDGNADFDLYRQQQACAIDQEMCTKTADGLENAGWNLDKYKNIHMAEKTYSLRPGYDWYVFVDADTYVSWPNLVETLHRLDPSKKRYLGSPTMIDYFAFAHGGSGYVVSGAVMKELAGKTPSVANSFDVRIMPECCGDYMFAVAINETIGVRVESMWPAINGEKPSTFPFGPGHWCHAISTMHHMNSEDVSEFWDFERRWYAGTQSPLVLKEVYHEFVEQKLVPVREDWDNNSDDWFYIDLDSPDHEWEDWRVDRAVKEESKSEVEKVAHKSFDDCSRACEEHDECFQFVWRDDSCGMKRTIVLGKPVKKEADDQNRAKSGWAIARIRKWVQEQGECKEVIWPDLDP